MRKLSFLVCLLCLYGLARGQTNDLTVFYWFNNQQNAPTAIPEGQSSFDIDVSSLSDGLHSFHCLAVQKDGGVSLPSTRYFLKVPSDEMSLKGYYWFDDEKAIHEVEVANGVFEVDCTSLSDGLHRIQLQMVMMTGAISKIYTSYFMRVTTSEEMGEMHCLYSIDDNAFVTDANVLGNNGNYHFDLDLSELSDGLHHISYMLYNDRGTSTKIQTRFFLKVPLGGNAIGHYQYWLNNDGISEAKTVTLPQNVNPLQLMSLLPVESRPIRSSSFQFDMSSGQPKLYAKNTIHLRFYDTAMRFTDVAKDYADHNVSQDVNIIKELESGARETTSWPEENEIKWYQVTAERGDSLSFKTDKAATLQLFSPSGKEVYAVSGSDVVKWGGLHVEENGTFYLALHDITATQGENISIYYEHIDRYAVLRQDVTVVGNGGCSTITFDGNGYDELTSVDLVLDCDTITSVEIGHESNATTSVKFDFTDATLGQYEAVFHFEEGELTVEKCVIVEEAIEPEFEISVNYAPQFLIGTSNKYYFKVHNKGNSTAYDVPLAIFIYSPDSLSLTKIGIDGYDLFADFKTYFGEQLTEEIAIDVENNIKEHGDLFFFQKYRNTDYVKDHPYLYWQIINPDIRPNADEVFTIELKTTQSSYLYMGIPDEWKKMKLGSKLNVRRGPKSNCAQQRYGRASPTDMAEFPEVYGSGCTPSDDSSEAHGNPVYNFDPNDIFGYIAESGSHAVKDGQNEVYYTIEFENDPEIATAPAHNIYVTDTLDASKFELSTFAPTRVKIGEKEAELTGDKNFVTTIDMRPEINAIAQVEGTFDEQKGIAKWHISSLDPMTMEPTDDVMQGVLPVNHGGNGMGEVMFDIGLKPGLAHGTAIDNRAAIVFDQNDVIMTPTWTNTIDRIAPVSHVKDVEVLNDSTAAVGIEANDELSGPWRYNVYVQYGSGAWFLGAENVPVDSIAKVQVYAGIKHDFYVVATDSAGNVEQKEAEREFSLTFYTDLRGDVNSDGDVDIADAVCIVNHVVGKATPVFNEQAADVNADGDVDIADAVRIVNLVVGKISSLARQLHMQNDMREPE